MSILSSCHLRGPEPATQEQLQITGILWLTEQRGHGEDKKSGAFFLIPSVNFLDDSWL